MFKKVVAWKSKKGLDSTHADHLSSGISSSDSIGSGSILLPPSSSTTYASNNSISDSIATDSGPLGLNVVYTPDHAHKADIVFVHGLGGTSRWTWSKNKDPELFWPLTFLPLEPDLCLSRILTFGYDASFQKSTSLATSVLDFAKDLLFDLKYAKDPSLNDLNMGNVPLIFVVHSMGGLIVKEAYMQGQHDPEYEAIIKAVCAITFIATPHRGTNLAQTLNRILDSTMLSNSKQYVADLVKNSPTLQKLNEQFRHVAPRLDIVSFYETQPTSIGIKSARLMVLEKETSVLGYPGEVSKALNADHHSVCKYEGPQDPNYITMRNILKSLMSKIISRDNAKKPALSDRRASIHLKSMLALPELPSTDYIFFRDRWTEGTCTWINQDPNFNAWRHSPGRDPHLLWLSGDAATGKSVLASFIVNSLVEEGYQCSYFFFRFGDRFKRTISLLFRSLAFQLAQADSRLMERMANLLDEALELETADYRVIWDRIFKSLIFETDDASPVYWVIDGLDESEDPRALVKLLLDIPASVPIRVFLTSRRTSEITSAFGRTPQHVKVTTIGVEGHLEDLRQHIRAELRVSGAEEFRDDVEKRIIEGSQNNFLWVRLAVERVNQCHISTDAYSVLDDFPVGMEALYQRMATSVADIQNTADKNLAIRILQCASCTLRALSTEELSQALGDVARNVLDLPRAISDLCGGFVVTDHDGNVTLIHQTARDYLSDSTSAFRPLHIDRQTAHKQLFLDCLRCLMSNNLRTGIARGQDLAFAKYAAEFWSTHLTQAARDDNECSAALKKFLAGRWSLTWIHILAMNGQLQVLIHSSRNLSRYASSQGKQDTGAGFQEQELFGSWAVDMLRIPGKFGQILRRKPDSIYTFVPPFCPRSSPVYQQFGRKDTLIVDGLSAEKWDDSLARMATGNAMASSIDAVASMIAVLSASGSVLFYDSTDFRQMPQSPLEHGERVTRMQLNTTATLLATYGYRTVKVWNVKSGECVTSIASIESKTRPLSMQFSEDNSTLLVGTDDRRVRLIVLNTNVPTWELVAELDEEEIEGQYTNAATQMALSRDGSMVAVGYRRHPVSAWELDGPMHIGLCRRTNDDSAIREVRELIWHPLSPDLFGLNFEGTVFRWAPYEDVVDEISTGATKLSLSKNGELLATGDSRGRIRLYATDGFILLYQLASQDAVFGLTFSPDSRRLYDIRGHHANAWEPTALAKFKTSSGLGYDTASEYDASLSTGISVANLEAVDPITAIATSPAGRIFCSGSAKGVVRLHDARSAKSTIVYTSRAKFTVERMTWSDDGKILSFTDASRHITLMTVSGPSHEGEPGAEQRAVIPMRSYTKEAITQVVFEPGAARLLVCTRSQLHVVSLETYEKEQTVDIKDSELTHWIPHPNDATLILGLGPGKLRILDWNLAQQGEYELIYRTKTSDSSDDPEPKLIQRAMPSQDKKRLLLQLMRSKQSSRSQLCFIETDKILISTKLRDEATSESSTIHVELFNTEISSQILRPLSFLPGNRLVFISNTFSLCLMRLSWTANNIDKAPSAPSTTCRQTFGNTLAPRPHHVRRSSRGSIDEIHELFALPGDWISQEALAISRVVATEKAFICPRNGEVAIVRCSALV
ncbi:hypothetical protein GGR57DRAFT_171175 [Xylariaceae sp. FL1272]|nr:hypothetical protein GGR57DRAFT_171175 [Xylariaceae sp. FL1272]